jgi:endonuclease/exonuclease/phosphatase family metal-dependent hydrolase
MLSKTKIGYCSLLNICRKTYFRDKRLFTVFFVLLPVLACTAAGRDNALPDSGLRVLTHNVWYGFTKIPDRKTVWRDWVKEQKPDIVLLQELNEYSPDRLSLDAEAWEHSYSVLLKQDGFPTGITSRFPVEDVHRFFEGFHHGLLRVRIKGIYIYNVHLHPSNWQVRNREIALILADIRNLPSGVPVIVAGDFNTFSPQDSVFYSNKRLEPFFADRDNKYNEKNLKKGRLDYAVLTKLLQDGFTDLVYWKQKNAYRFTGTFPSGIDKSGDHGSRRRLDYVFANSYLVPHVQRASVIDNDTTRHLSDHLPVIVEFAINPQ